VRGSFDEGLAAARALGDRDGYVLVNSLNPDRLEGQKTAAFELVEELGHAPDVLALPYGGGGNLCAYARGFAEAGVGTPRLVAGEAEDRAVTVASAIRITRPAHAEGVEDAVRASGGAVVPVSDEAIVEAWVALARDEGIFCEPASAAGLAALSAKAEPGGRVVCVLTGHGLKDPDTALGKAPAVIGCEADAAAVERLVFD
jgi:threonine synthase